MAFQFMDTAKIRVTAGRGGRGCQSFHKQPGERFRRADGGDGGDGGSVMLVADPSVGTLLDCAYRKQYRATHGKHGGSKGKHGGRGEDMVVRVPVGTVVRDAETGALLRDLATANDELIVAKGGRGGFGNMVKREATPGTEGQDRLIGLELKLIADVGFVGLPNAGKSSLLRRISRATPRVADYPFTTKTPVLGVVSLPERDQTFVACDIPGLIAGAHEGKGLGLAFLRHIERTKTLLYVVDMAGTEGRHPRQDFETVRAEALAYSAALGEKPWLIAANKIDLPMAAPYLREFQQAFGDKVYPISAATGAGIPALIRALADQLCVATS